MSDDIQSFHADEWFKHPDRGWIALVSFPRINRAELGLHRGSKVLIDEHEYTVLGVELHCIEYVNTAGLRIEGKPERPADE
jgi:hypothetical protein